MTSPPEPATTPAPVPTEETEPPAEPAYPADEDEDDDTAMVMYEYVGCYADEVDDRVLVDKLDSPAMTLEVSTAVYLLDLRVVVVPASEGWSKKAPLFVC